MVHVVYAVYVVYAVSVVYAVEYNALIVLSLAGNTLQ